MANCSGIFQDQTISCSDPLAVGVEQRLFLANLDDVDSITYDGTNTHIITDITMKTGKRFWEFAGVNQTIKARYELQRNPTSNSYRHFVDLSVFAVGDQDLENVEAMAYKPQIAIVLQRDDSSLGNGAITVYGPNSGMEAVTITRDLGDVETGGAQVIQLATPDSGAIETRMPDPFFTTDYATTLAAVEALKTPAA